MKIISTIIYAITLSVYAIAFIALFYVILAATIYFTKVVVFIVTCWAYYKILCFIGKLFKKRLTVKE